MSLNNLELSPLTVSRLYETALISNDTPSESKRQKGIKSLGKNLKKIVFLVNNEEMAFVTDEEMLLLTNLLNACNLSLEDIALINYSKSSGLTNSIIKENFNNQILIVFGVSCSQLQLPFNVPEFQKYNFNDCTYLFGPYLKEFIANASLKRSLWQCLKTIFNI